MKLVYKIKRLCFDAMGVPPYEDNPTEEFNSWDDAWDFLVKLAEEEINYLDSDCDKEVSFGIPKNIEYENKMLCRVEYYYNPDGDDMGNTEIVTQYWVYSERADK